MSKKDKSEQGIQESDNQTKLITIQDAAKQLGIKISKFLTYFKDHRIERKSTVKGIPPMKEMLTIGACVGKQKFYRLTEDDLQQFINHKDNILNVSNKDTYTHWYELSRQKGATLGFPAYSFGDEEKTYSVSVEGLYISENDFALFKKVLAKNDIYFISFNCDATEVTINGEKRCLSQREFRVLRVLYETKDKLLSKEDIMKKIQTGEHGEQQIFNIISKLRNIPGIKIENKKGTKNHAGGYRLITKT